MAYVALFLIAAVGVGFVMAPLFRSRRAKTAGAPAEFDEAWLDGEVERYRKAVRAGTVCGRCRFANPPGSRYCADCGTRLAEE